MNRSGCGLFYDTIRVFTWTYEEISQISSFRTVGNSSDIQSGQVYLPNTKRFGTRLRSRSYMIYVDLKVTTPYYIGNCHINDIFLTLITFI
jgi:hypothetical protein